MTEGAGFTESRGDLGGTYSVSTITWQEGAVRWGSVSPTVPAVGNLEDSGLKLRQVGFRLYVRKKIFLWSRGGGAELMVGLVDLKGVFQS